MCQANVVVDKVETDEPIENFQKDLCYISKFFFLNRNFFNCEELIVNKYFLCLFVFTLLSALIGLRTSGVRIVSISVVTKVPHNGCRPKRRPRK